MSKPSTEHVAAGMIGESAGSKPNALQSADGGFQAPPAPQTKSAAGGGNLLPQPSVLSRESLFSLLIEAVRDLESRGSSSAAAGVSSRMRRINPAFRLPDSNFPSFRALLEAAVQMDYVALAPAPSGSDVIVSVGGNLPTSEIEVPSQGALDRLKPDIWRAFLSWSDQSRHAYSRTLQRAVRLDGSSDESSDRVQITPITRDEQIVWMKAFSNEQTSEEIKDQLLEALGADDPVAAFSKLARERKSIAYGWKAYLRRQVLARVTSWAHEYSIPFRDVQIRLGREGVDEKTAQSSVKHGSLLATPDQVLREQILQTIARLPLSELTQIRIPVEYLFRR